MKMKFTKKIATILLSVCLIVPCFSVMALAANGVIFFSDLETSVGDEFTITGTAVVSGDVIGDATIHMTYDCLLYTSPSPRDGATSRMPSSA